MPLKTLSELRDEIDAAGPGLNGVLQSLATELTSLPVGGTTYRASLCTLPQISSQL